MTQNSIFRSLLCSLCLLVPLSACGPLLSYLLTEDARTTKTPDASIPYDSPQERSQLWDTLTYTCQDPSQCPEHTALLVNEAEGSFGRCTSFLIGPKHMATNTHCLRGFQRATDYDCSEEIHFFFASRPQEFKCRKVVKASALGSSAVHSELDYAILELDTEITDRTPLRFERLPKSFDSGWTSEALVQAFDPDDQTVTVAKFNPKSEKDLRHELVVTNCKTKADSLWINKSDRKVPHSVVTFAECGEKVIQGNSGSAAVGPSGEVRAIIQAITREPEMQKYFDSIPALQSYPKDRLEQLIKATRGFCAGLEPLSKQEAEICSHRYTQTDHTEGLKAALEANFAGVPMENRKINRFAQPRKVK